MQKELSSTDFGLIGHPLVHSYSKKFFTELFADCGSDLSYDNFDLPALTPEALYSLVLLNPRLKGFNVTAPYKEAVMEYLDSVSDCAARVGAVNTVVVRRSPDGRVLGLHGHNTDVGGFLKSVQPMLDSCAKGKGALILGTGGASKAAAEALRQAEHPFLKVSRTKKDSATINYADITAATLADYPLIVNTTPAGTFPDADTRPPFPVELLGAGCAVFDMVYNPGRTLLMKEAEARGAMVCNGLAMLHNQALASLRIWLEANPDIDSKNLLM